MQTLPCVGALAWLALGLSAAGCTISHTGSPRLAPLDTAWHGTEEGRIVWQRDDIRVIASRTPASLEFPFGGTISNFQDAPVRVEFRPIGVQVPPDRAVAETRYAGQRDSVPILVGRAVDVVPHDSDRSPDPNDLEFGLHRTQGEHGPRPFEADDVVSRHVTQSGIVASQYPGFARLGDEAHYEIVVSGERGTVVCPYHMQFIEGREIVDFPWWKWPIAVVLAPIGIPLLLLGVGH